MQKRSDSIKISKNNISIAGEFAVLTQLALRGIDANLTLGNTKSVDIIASDPSTGKMFKLEVKTSYNSKPATSKLFGRTLDWVMTVKHETITDPNLYYCFVNIEKEAYTFRFFIVPSSIVARYVREQHQFWLNRDNAGHEKPTDNPIRRFRLGLEEGGYLIDTPLAKDYENNWNFYL
jgi:hypothetical protein